MVEEELRFWRRVDPKTVSLAARLELNQAECTWSIVLQEGKPFVTAYRHRDTPLPPGFSLPDGLGRPAAAQRVGAGVLLGFDHGEWGGSLAWYSERGVLQRSLLSDNVLAILPAFGEFVVLTTTGHGGQGRVVEVREEPDLVVVGRAVDLPDGPVAARVENRGTPLVATGKGLVRVSHDFRVEDVLRSEWWMLGAKTLALRADHTAYVGMRGVVAEVRLDQDPPAETWLYPP